MCDPQWCLRSPSSTRRRTQDFVYLTVELRDKTYANVLGCLPASNLFIESALHQGGKVLVHWFVRPPVGPPRAAAVLLPGP